MILIHDPWILISFTKIGNAEIVQGKTNVYRKNKKIFTNDYKSIVDH